jgi:hypothetical protein
MFKQSSLAARQLYSNVAQLSSLVAVVVVLPPKGALSLSFAVTAATPLSPCKPKKSAPGCCSGALPDPEPATDVLACMPNTDRKHSVRCSIPQQKKMETQKHTCWVAEAGCRVGPGGASGLRWLCGWWAPAEGGGARLERKPAPAPLELAGLSPVARRTLILHSKAARC